MIELNGLELDGIYVAKILARDENIRNVNIMGSRLKFTLTNDYMSKYARAHGAEYRDKVIEPSEMDDNLQKLLTWTLDQLEFKEENIGIDINAIDSILSLCSTEEGFFYAQPLTRLKNILIKSLNNEYSTMLDNVLINVKEILHGGQL